MTPQLFWLEKESCNCWRLNLNHCFGKEVQYPFLTSRVYEESLHMAAFTLHCRSRITNSVGTILYLSINISINWGMIHFKKKLVIPSHLVSILAYGIFSSLIISAYLCNTLWVAWNFYKWYQHFTSRK